MSPSSHPDKWWETTPLAEMSTEQWENLCDGCGRCCLVKIYHRGEITPCRVSCSNMDLSTGSCRDYANRTEIVPNCHNVTLDKIDDPGFLPSTCAYKLIKNGQPLHPWHHLISGSRETVKTAGISIAGKISLTEDTVRTRNLPLLVFAEKSQVGY